MRYGTTTTTAAILMALVATAPLTAGAADEKTQTTTQEAKTMMGRYSSGSGRRRPLGRSMSAIQPSLEYPHHRLGPPDSRP